MKRIRIIGLALVAVFALSAVAASSAMAVTEFAKVVNKEGKELTKKKFTGKNTTTEQLLQTVGKRTIKCKEFSATGEVKGSHEGEATFTLKGCESTSFGAGKCFTTGQAEGTIVSTVSIQAVYLKKGAPVEVALLLSILPLPTGFQEVKCKTLLGTEVIKVYGTFLTPVKTGSLATKYTMTAKQKEGKQEPLEYEPETGKKAKNTLETEGVSGPEVFAKEQSGEGAAGEATFEEEVEFK